MKKYLINGMALLAMGMIVTSCSKDNLFTDADAVKHAESVLGVTIDPNQDWKMTQEVTANVTVNMGTGKEYTLFVFDKSPFDNKDAVYYTKKKVTDATVSDLSLSVPSHLTQLYVTIMDSNNHSVSKYVTINGKSANTVFGTAMANSSNFTLTRSFTAPEVSDIDAPYDAAWVAEYLQTAKEPTEANVTDNSDNGYYQGGTDPVFYNPIGDAGTVVYGGTIEDKTLEAFILKWIKPFFAAMWWGGSWTDVEGATDQTSAAKIIVSEIAKAGYQFSDLINGNPGSEGTYVPDETYVLNFKITGTWNGGINVAASEGLTDGNPSNAERTIVVTGTWNISEDQKIGGLGRVIVANGGTINISSGKTLSSVNEAQLVVLSGGSITGEGAIEFCNGTSSELNSYNGGTINVGKFNNNGGNFYNYGTLQAAVMDGGAGNSRYYNHSLVKIGETGSSANLRIYNNCQWYCSGDMRARNYEGVGGSSIIVDGELMFSSSADGTSDPTYVGLAAGALVKCDMLYNNGTSWSGPAEGGYGVLSTRLITFLNWEQDHPEQGGYFANNIYVCASVWSNAPGGNGMGGESAEAKFKNVQNATGNGNVTIVQEGDDEVIPASEDFEKGVSGCTPGFKKKGGDEGEEEHDDEIEPTPAIYSYAFEDSYMADYDMNDVVVKVRWKDEVNNPGVVIATLCCTGATYDLSVWLTINGSDSKLFGNEVHAALGGAKGSFINTLSFTPSDPKIVYINDVDPATEEFSVPTDTDLSDLDIWIKSPEGNIHVAKQGQDPHGVIIPEDWEWPMEWTSVKTAYPKFADFARDMTTNKDWYKLENQTETPGKIYGK